MRHVVIYSFFDNGKGLPADFTHISDSASLDFKLICILVNPLQAKQQIHTNNTGTTFAIFFTKTSAKGATILTPLLLQVMLSIGKI